MAVLTAALLFLCTGLLRIALCSWRGITGVEFCIGAGPELWSWHLRSGTVSVRLLPISEWAKLPMRSIEEDGEPMREVCAVSLRDQSIVSTATLIPPLLVVLLLSPWVDLRWLTTRMWDECAALLGALHGANLVHGAMILTMWTPAAAAATALTFLVINALPSPVLAGGFLLGMNSVPWMNRGWVRVVLVLYPVPLALLALLAVLL